MRHVVGTVVVIVILLAAPEVSAVSGLKSPGTIRITTREVKTTRVDVGRRGLSPGDVEVIRNQLFNTRLTPRSIGHGELVCTYTVSSSRNCTGTYFLPKGKIVVGGPIFYRQLYELAVLGGTGLYDNVRGSLTATSVGNKPRREILIFRLNVG
jgi:hypothetical protein